MHKYFYTPIVIPTIFISNAISKYLVGTIELRLSVRHRTKALTNNQIEYRRLVGCIEKIFFL